MAVVGWEIILVGIIVLVLFIWGPQKIPEMARSIGRARREFEEASKNITRPISPQVIENAAPSPSPMLLANWASGRWGRRNEKSLTKS